MMDKNALLDFFTQNGIEYVQYEHPAVYTCEQVDLYCPAMPGVGTKNLLLRDKKGRLILLMTSCDLRVDLKQLGESIGYHKLHFASEQQLQDILGVNAGAVTVLGLVNDTHHQTTLFVDEEVWGNHLFQCHPLVNTATLVLSKDMLQRFLDLTHHKVHFYRPE
jgi:Ala-tRNA(Pro) deacylase